MAHILVIRLGALGDFIQSFGPFAAIRAHHAGDHLTLLTTAPFRPLGEAAPWFDSVLIDTRPGFWQIGALWRLARLLRGFDFVYDLQTSRRSSLYFRLAGRPPWSGIAPGCSHPHANPERDFMHTRERQHEQLRMAGIGEFPSPDLAWLVKRGEVKAPAPPYAVLIPGAAPRHPAKRWPVGRYAALARHLAERGLRPVIAGGPAEQALAAAIRAEAPGAEDLTGRTDLFGLARLLAGAALVIGNDTGPMHLATALGRPAIVLFSGASDPALTAPRYPDGGWPVVLRAPDLAQLPAERVVEALPLAHRPA
jgi:ADP-heptose:LPS heptosyltransferase